MIAHYRTQRGAQRYANEITNKFPSVAAVPRQHPHDFGFGVFVVTPTGASAWADCRPKNYSTPYAAGSYRIASKGLQDQGE